MNTVQRTINNALQANCRISVISEEGVELSKSRNAFKIYNMVCSLEEPVLRIWSLEDENLGWICVDALEVIDYSDNPKIDALIALDFDVL